MRNIVSPLDGIRSPFGRRFGFVPSQLFASGEQGVWYDPSDLSTLFQDSAGTIPVTAVEQPVGRILDKSGRGNHATQSTPTSCPVLSARVNLLTYTEQFNNAAWVVGSVGGASVPTAVSANEVSFPAITASGQISVIRQAFTSVVTSYVGSVELKAKASADVGKKIAIWINDGTVVNFTFHTLTADWVRISVTEPTGALPVTYFTIGVTGSGISGGGNQDACTVNIRNADLRPANTGVGLPAYQRVGASTDYDTTGFPMYLRFDGTDDSMATGTITPGVDKAQVFAGVRKLSDAAGGVVMELSVASAFNDGTLAFNAPAAGTPDYFWRSKGTISASSATAASYPAPLTSVMTGIGDIAGDVSQLRYNGAQILNITTDQGTGNYLSYPLYIGRRGGTTLPFNGHLYSLIVRFSATNLPAATIAQTETWVNGKTYAY